MSSDSVCTPTEDLFMEVLAGRYRCGEQSWTFVNAHKGTARRLEERGWVHLFSSQTERTFRAGLTEQGIKAWALDQPYFPPNRSGDRRDCYEHPEVGAAFACARCRVGRRDRCILKED